MRPTADEAGPSCAWRASPSGSATLLANDGIDLELRRGEILALLGENGAGKTTLMSILFGHYVADAGRVLVADARARCGLCRRARRTRRWRRASAWCTSISRWRPTSRCSTTSCWAPSRSGAGGATAAPRGASSRR